MLKRPLDKRFSQPVLDGLKVTTIRDKPWPLGVFIMLYHWAGAPYRSKQIDVASILVTSVSSIHICRPVEGPMIYSTGPIWRSEGFPDEQAMDDWFRPLVKPGQTGTKSLMRFRLFPSR